MKVRRALPGESEALSTLAVDSKSLWGYSSSQLASWVNELRISPASIVDEPTFVAEEQNRIAGVVQLSTSVSPWSVECLWVHPSLSRRGIGSLLVRHALAFARSHDQRALHIDSDPNAEPFYVYLGARKVGAVPAPIEGQPARERPQLILSTENAE